MQTTTGPDVAPQDVVAPERASRKTDVPLKRKPGGQPGNRNAVTHGRRSEQAREFRDLLSRVRALKRRMKVGLARAREELAAYKSGDDG